MTHASMTYTPNRVLGVLQVMIAGHMHTVSVESVDYADGSNAETGGFFVGPEGRAGIFVPEGASPTEVDTRIRDGLAEAVKHFSRAFTN